MREKPRRTFGPPLSVSIIILGYSFVAFIANFLLARFFFEMTDIELIIFSAIISIFAGIYTMFAILLADFSTVRTLQKTGDAMFVGIIFTAMPLFLALVMASKLEMQNYGISVLAIAVGSSTYLALFLGSFFSRNY